MSARYAGTVRVVMLRGETGPAAGAVRERTARAGRAPNVREWRCAHRHAGRDAAMECAAAEVRRLYLPPRGRGRPRHYPFASVTAGAAETA